MFKNCFLVVLSVLRICIRPSRLIHRRAFIFQVTLKQILMHSSIFRGELTVNSPRKIRFLDLWVNDSLYDELPLSLLFLNFKQVLDSKTTKTESFWVQAYEIQLVDSTNGTFTYVLELLKMCFLAGCSASCGKMNVFEPIEPFRKY